MIELSPGLYDRDIPKPHVTIDGSYAGQLGFNYRNYAKIVGHFITEEEITGQSFHFSAAEELGAVGAVGFEPDINRLRVSVPAVLQQQLPGQPKPDIDKAFKYGVGFSLPPLLQIAGPTKQEVAISRAFGVLEVAAALLLSASIIHGVEDRPGIAGGNPAIDLLLATGLLLVAKRGKKIINIHSRDRTIETLANHATVVGAFVNDFAHLKVINILPGVELGREPKTQRAPRNRGALADQTS